MVQAFRALAILVVALGIIILLGQFLSWGPFLVCDLLISLVAAALIVRLALRG